MRTLVVATVAAAVLALTGGCTGGTGSGTPEGPQDTGSATPPDPTTSDAPPPLSKDAVADSEACSEVRAGIDAFNAGGFDETVEHFQAALPLAQAQDDGSVRAGQLVEAVRYYAQLEAGLYPEAARSSPAFARYKAITLGQCVAAGGATSEPPGTSV